MTSSWSAWNKVVMSYWTIQMAGSSRSDVMTTGQWPPCNKRPEDVMWQMDQSRWCIKVPEEEPRLALPCTVRRLALAAVAMEMLNKWWIFLERGRKLFFVLIWTTPYRRAEEPHRCIYWSLITATVSTRRSKVCPHLHKRLKSSDSNMFYSSSSVTNVAWSHTPTHVRWDTHDQIQCNCFLLLTFSTLLPLSRECHAMQRTHTHTYISTHTLCDVYFISFLDILCSL